MRIIYLCLISALLAACSGDRLFKKEKKYTPLYVYYNPLNYNQNYDFAELFYPDYINYPDDRIKYGLRGNVSLVLYGSADAGIEYIFDDEGKLRTVSSFLDRARRYIELREFRYTDGRLAGVYRNPQMTNGPPVNKSSSMMQPDVWSDVRGGCSGRIRFTAIMKTEL